MANGTIFHFYEQHDIIFFKCWWSCSWDNWIQPVLLRPAFIIVVFYALIIMRYGITLFVKLNMLHYLFLNLSGRNHLISMPLRISFVDILNDYAAIGNLLTWLVTLQLFSWDQCPLINVQASKVLLYPLQPRHFLLYPLELDLFIKVCLFLCRAIDHVAIV